MRWERARFPTAPLLLAVVGLLIAASAAEAQADAAALDGPEAFDGSFRLETGEVVTGGYMVEGGDGWVYIDTENLRRGGVFERDGLTARSLPMMGAPAEIEFLPGPDGGIDRIMWREDGASLAGERVYPHTSEPVRFKSADGTELEGRLLLPRCEGPHPAVVTVHGSGPVNRYGGTFHTFFLKHGVAVLAYDKRGYTDDPSRWQEPDFAEMSADAAAAVRFLAARPEVDADRVGLWGSSQGGWTVPRAALDAPETAYMILRAGAALGGAETVLHEVRQELRAEGIRGMALDHAMDLRREIYRLAMDGEAIEAADRLVEPYLDEPWYRAAFGDGPASLVWSETSWGWMQRNHGYAPAPDVARFDGPVLWFLGELDENVPFVSTRTALERAFAESPGNDEELVVIEDSPHSFIIPSEQGPSRYAKGFFEKMADWMAERGFTNEACWEVEQG